MLLVSKLLPEAGHADDHGGRNLCTVVPQQCLLLLLLGFPVGFAVAPRWAKATQHVCTEQTEVS
jgi:hypothetical protein